MERLSSDIARGWQAPVGRLVTGGLVALGVSAPVLVVLHLAGTPVGAATVFGGLVQLAVTYWVAGRLDRMKQE